MRLSNAMATGRVLRVHMDHQSLPFDSDRQGCALQIGLAALGIDAESSVYLRISRVYPWTRAAINCPECGKVNEVYAVIGACLNDTHKWNLDRIIDFVRSIEPPEDDDMAPSGQPEAVKVASDPASASIIHKGVANEL